MRKVYQKQILTCRIACCLGLCIQFYDVLEGLNTNALMVSYAVHQIMESLAKLLKPKNAFGNYILAI